VISEHAFETLRAFAEEALRTERGPVRERVHLRNAIDELEDARRFRADRKLVEDAIAHHVRAGLLDMHPGTHPEAGDLWPTSTYASAQWHATRAHLLTLAPVTVAATVLREEALAALDTNPKDTDG
jgi:hypothetical protein